MAIKIANTVLPTTMVGSYPRPSWYRQQLLGRDIRVAFKEVSYEETYDDAVATIVRDQEEAGLDVVTDGNMWYDDYVLDIRTNAIETPETIAKRIRNALLHVPAEKVTLSTDCGMKPVARMVAKMKLRALAQGAAIVRNE